MSMHLTSHASATHPRRAAWVAAVLVSLAAFLGAARPEAPAEVARPEQVAKLGADAWHQAGYRGKGIKVAILDSGFRGYKDQLGKALPEHVTARTFRKDGNFEARDSQHGVLCAEVVHALAPEAELILANWEPDEPETFLEAVRWARKEGAQVITCSVIAPSWSDGEGGGPVHAALTKLLGPGDAAGDLLCFASAGNIAQRHWAGKFRGGDDGFHRWSGDQRDNEVTPWGGERVSVELCCGEGSSYELTVLDKETGKEVTSAVAGRKGPGCVVARFQPEGGRGYVLRVRLLSGPGGSFHLTALSAGLDCSTAQGSLPFPADGPEVLAVGAVDAAGKRMGYSSCGPNSTQPKPDFVAPVPFTSSFRSTPFGGTSCASPQAAAVAALCWSRHPDWTASQVRSALRASAQDLATPGHDCETGYGMVHLPGVKIDLGQLARDKDPFRTPKKGG